MKLDPTHPLEVALKDVPDEFIVVGFTVRFRANTPGAREAVMKHLFGPGQTVVGCDVTGAAPSDRGFYEAEMVPGSLSNLSESVKPVSTVA